MNSIQKGCQDDAVLNTLVNLYGLLLELRKNGAISDQIFVLLAGNVKKLEGAYKLKGMIYIPKFFRLWEVLPKEFYQGHAGKGDKLWFLFDSRILHVADQLRSVYGKMICNTWYWGGGNQYRGYRPIDCGIGAEFSQHKFGRALDLVPIDVSVDRVRDEIILNRKDWSRITAIELEVNWLHIDCRNWDGDILLIKP